MKVLRDVMKFLSFAFILKWGGGGGGGEWGLFRVWAANKVTVFVYLILKRGLGLRPWATHTCLKFLGPENLFSAPPHHS